ncbi:uncharacterized protein LAESUDRAFT_361400 [Laetiporus sulphureus 93-53]|uniref:Uncharacterized protein n=1 Tax=Laetiporus sulphureus 93-53 TaxID=1314785 RepID=A0A165GZ14_9APHY|nr:uncharacterized protein LAESUDRAFT_361400 [Laetiporus sulphureus 93-53]KZT11023.1 hypothetical protein LAESUDRAFT_361400 [Laetiporus sulphureus 93-53]
MCQTRQIPFQARSGEDRREWPGKERRSFPGRLPSPPPMASRPGTHVLGRFGLLSTALVLMRVFFYCPRRPSMVLCVSFLSCGRAPPGQGVKIVL